MDFDRKNNKVDEKLIYIIEIKKPISLKKYPFNKIINVTGKGRRK